jgi:hypothetical protein
VRAGTKIRFVSGGPGWLQAYSREATAYYGLAAVLNARMQISSGPLPKINQLEKTDVIPSPQKCWVHVGHRVKTVCSSSSIEFWVNILWVTGIIKDELWRRSDQPVGVAPFACPDTYAACDLTHSIKLKLKWVDIFARPGNQIL